jgi:uncharacterized protein (TIGR03067 family)
MRNPPLHRLGVALFPLTLLAALALAADPADKDKDKGGDAEKDKAALKGKWEPMSSESGGNKDDESEYKQYRLVFDGDKFTILKSGEEHMKGTMKIDASQKPRRLDLVIEECQEGDMKGKSLEGIYELKGDELKWCFVPPDKGDRPKEFASQSDTSQINVTLKREK